MSIVNYFYIDSDLIESKKLIRLLSDSDQNKAIRFRLEEDRVRFCIGRLLIKKSLQDYGTPIEWADIRVSQYGKPFVSNGPEFNISHSGNLVVIAISDQAVGIDIEIINNVNTDDFNNILSKNERRVIDQSVNPGCTLSHIWTKKEAVLKAYGTGMSSGIQQLDTTAEVILYKDRSFFVYPVELDEAYICSLASTVELNDLPIIKYSLSDLML